VHTQVCPLCRYLDSTAAVTAASRSASSKTRNGALPPSSSVRRLTVSAHCADSSLPTSVEPVNEISRTAGLAHRVRPMAGASPVITLSTPAGSPARCPSSAMASADSGVCSAGLSTTVQPAASAGAALRVIMAAGKFHGVMQPTTPIGCRSTMIRLSSLVAGISSPRTRCPSAA